MMESIVIALIAAAPPTVAALAALRRASQTHRTVGNKNGQGTITEMNERQLILLGKLDERLAAHIADNTVHRIEHALERASDAATHQAQHDAERLGD